MITVFSDNKEIKTNYVQFSDGAITYKLQALPEKPRYISINVDPCTPVNEVREEVGMAVSCIENYYGGYLMEQEFTITLNMPYLPYSRADRVFEKGNPSPLFDFISWLDQQGFDEINICDIHNSKSLGTGLASLVEKTQLHCFKESLPCDFDTKYDYVVAPDHGAMEKAKTIADHLGIPVVHASKKRYLETGRILETVLPNVIFSGAKLLIPDDILDGGMTFIKLAEKLKEHGACSVDLYVTHLIACKGLKCLTPHIDKLYYHHTVGHYVNDQNVLDFNNNKL